MEKNKVWVEIGEGGGNGWSGGEGPRGEGRKLFLKNIKIQKYLIKKEEKGKKSHGHQQQSGDFAGSRVVGRGRKEYRVDKW